MKKKISLLMTFICVITMITYAAISCTEKDEFTPQLSLSVPELSISAVSANADTFSVLTNTSWTASVSKDWFSVSPVSGNGNGIITISAQQNSDTTARTGTITISIKEGLTKTINITQSGALSVSADTLVVAADSNSVSSFNLSSNTNWKIECADAWLSVKPSSGSKKANITITAKQNTDTASRTTALIITEEGAAPKTIKVLQSGAIYRISVSRKTVTLGPVANTIDTFSVFSNSTWTISEPPSWLKLNTTAGVSNDVVTATALETPTTSKSRTASLILTARYAKKAQTVKITQTGIPCIPEDEQPCPVSGCAIPSMPAYASLPNNAFLPDPFTFMNGSRMTSLADWKCRRAEIAALAQEFQYGYKPCTPYSAVTASFSANTITINVSQNGKTISFACAITYPAIGSAPYPAVIGIGGSSLNNSHLLSLGVAIISFPNNDIAAQGGTGTRGNGKFYDLFCRNHSAGALMAWSWGVSRLIDALEKTPAANIDTEHLAVTGCSRNGKGALCAGAFDERIILTIPQESGSGGSASWRVSDFQGSDVQRLQQIVTENCWFREDFARFNLSANKLPYDHHMIAALCAPRALLIVENTSMTWLGNVSTWVTGNTAHMIWKALGKPENMGFSQFSHSDHCGYPAAQLPELTAYVKKFLLESDAESTLIMKTDGSLNFDTAKWVNWTIPELH